MPSRQDEVAIGREQGQPVSDAKLCEQGIDGADLQAGAATAVAELSRLDVVLPIRRKQREIVEVVEDRLTGAWPGEALQELL